MVGEGRGPGGGGRVGCGSSAQMDHFECHRNREGG